MGLRRWQREDGDKFYRQCACCASLSRKWDVLFKLKPRRGARDAPSIELSCEQSQVGERSRYRCDTLSGRVPRWIGEDVGRVEEEIWRRLEETVTKSGGEGGKQQSSAGNSPSRWEYISDMIQEKPSLMIGLTHRKC